MMATPKQVRRKLIRPCPHGCPGEMRHMGDFYFCPRCKDEWDLELFPCPTCDLGVRGDPERRGHRMWCERTLIGPERYDRGERISA